MLQKIGNHYESGDLGTNKILDSQGRAEDESE
jgi:hypothetical protein